MQIIVDMCPPAAILCPFPPTRKASAAEGRGKLIDKHTVEVALTAGGTKRITGKTILVATGGKPSKIDIPGSVSPSPALLQFCSKPSP